MLLVVAMGKVTVFQALQMTRFALVMVVQEPFRLVAPCTDQVQAEVGQLRMRFWLEITGKITGDGRHCTVTVSGRLALLLQQSVACQVLV